MDSLVWDIGCGMWKNKYWVCGVAVVTRLDPGGGHGKSRYEEGGVGGTKYIYILAMHLFTW